MSDDEEIKTNASTSEDPPGFGPPPSGKANLKPVFIGIALVLASYPLWRDSGRETTEIPQSIEGESFPSGPAGLVDSNSKSDRLRAMTGQYREESEERAGEPVIKTQAASSELPDEKSDAEEVSEEDYEEQTASKETPKSNKSSTGPFRQAFHGVSKGINFTVDAKDTLWIGHRYGLISLKESDLKQPRVVLSPGIYDREFNDTLGPITAVGTSSGDTTWLGFANGQLMRYQRYEWQVLATPRDGIKASISSITEHKGNIFIASRGLFRWDDSFKRAALEPNFKKRRIFATLKSDDGSLYLGGRSGLWQRSLSDDGAESWKRIWKPSKKDQGVYSILETKDSSFLLGTSDGLARVSKSGVVEDRLLQGLRVTSITRNAKDEGYWIGTRNGGLRFWNGEDFYHADSEIGFTDNVSSVHIDKFDRLWIGFEDKGVFVASRKEAQVWLESHSDIDAQGFQPQVFTDACEAADTIIPGVSVSDDIAVESLDGRGVVFMRGVQQCPKGIGYRRKDGTVVTMKGWNATVYLAKARQQLVIPEGLPADKATVVLLDSKNRLWFGTENRGVFRIDAESKYFQYGANEGLANNRVSSILEDSQGRIWVGTVPTFDQDEKLYHSANLHLYTDDGWYHFDPRNGLIQISTHSMSFNREKDLLVGTHGGFSIIDPDGNTTSYGPKQGLKTFFVKSISQDRNKRIWLGHQYYGNGVSWFDGESFHRTDETHGLFYDRIEVVAHDRAKRIWLIGSNGRVGVYPFSFFKKNKVSSPVIKKAVRTVNLIK